MQSTMISDLKAKFDEDVAGYEQVMMSSYSIQRINYALYVIRFEQSCLDRVAAAEAEAARSYDVVEERDKRLRFLWWKDDLRSMKMDEANTLRWG